MTHHRRALMTITAAVVLDTTLGLAFAFADHVPVADGLYWATTTATTVGYGDVVPKAGLPRVIAVLVMLTVIPLFAATFSLLTSGLTSTSVTDSEHRMKAHFEERLRSHLGGEGRRM